MTITSGIDVGTGAIKVALFEVDGDNETCLAKQVERVRQRDPLKLAGDLYDDLLKGAGLSRGDVAYCATTGEGESLTFHTGHFYSMTTHARGAIFLQPHSRAVLDTGARGATTTFAQRKMGDALATFESEVPLIRSEFGDDFDVVYPGWTVLAENPVSVVDKVVDRRGTRAVSEAYLKWLWSDEGQTIAARHHLRPRSAKVLKAFAKDFPPVSTFTVAEVFGGWKKAQKTHFDDGGIYDQIVLKQGRR